MDGQKNKNTQLSLSPSIWACLFFALFFLSSVPAFAQQNSAVIVDTSVLDELDPHHNAPPVQQQPQTYRLPAPSLPPPSGTALREYKRPPVYTPPAAIQTQKVPLEPEKLLSHRDVPVSKFEPLPYKIVPDAPKPGRKPVHEIAALHVETEAPIPELKPEPESENRKEVIFALETKSKSVPVPSRKPKNLIAAFARKKSTEYKQAKYTIPAKKVDGPNVKAMPPETVVVQKLRDHDKSTGPSGHLRVRETNAREVTNEVKTVMETRNIDMSDNEQVKKLAGIKPAAGRATSDILTPMVGNKTPGLAQRANFTDDDRSPRPPPSEDRTDKGHLSVIFPKGMKNLDADMTETMQQDIIPTLKSNPDWRMQILSFAAPPNDASPNDARRISLSRALSVRSYLLSQGIDSQRMDVRALGMQTDRAPLDRVDLVLFDPASR